MHFSQRRTDQSEERILPLVNVVFLLLIFFMVVGSLSIAEPFDVDPPESASDERNDPQALTILMNEDGRLALEGETGVETELLQDVEDALKESPDTRVALKADGNVPANRLVRFSQALREVGVEKLRLLTLSE